MVNTQIRLWKALGDETRIRILKLLEEGELCVCHIMAVLHMGQSRISRHMGILKQAGLVHDRRVGKWILYRLAEGQVGEEVPAILGFLRHRLNDHRQVQQDKARLAQLASKVALGALSLGRSTNTGGNHA